MNLSTLSKIKQTFEGRVCTIFTSSLNKTLSDRAWREHFVCRVLEINQDGLFGQHPYTGQHQFYWHEGILSIQEETELDPANPEHAKMIREYENDTGIKLTSDVSPHLAASQEDETHTEEHVKEDLMKTTLASIPISAIEEIVREVSRVPSSTSLVQIT